MKSKFIFIILQFNRWADLYLNRDLPILNLIFDYIHFFLRTKTRIGKYLELVPRTSVLVPSNETSSMLRKKTLSHCGSQKITKSQLFAVQEQKALPSPSISFSIYIQTRESRERGKICKMTTNRETNSPWVTQLC
jgi:hypothetical protein